MLPLTNGVPQGSILGPVLFTTYINDLISAIIHNHTAAYVDDSQLYFKFPVSDSSSAMAAIFSKIKNLNIYPKLFSWAKIKQDCHWIYLN